MPRQSFGLLTAGLVIGLAAPACLVAAAPPAAKAQRLFAYDVGTGSKSNATYLEYALPSGKTTEYTGYYSFSTSLAVAGQIMYFANEGHMYSLSKANGPATPKLLFGAPNAGGVSVDSKKNIYAVDNYNSTVDEYTAKPVQGGGNKTPKRVLSLAPTSALFTVVDHQDNVWIALANSSIVVYGPTGTAPIATFSNGFGIRDITVDANGAVWVLYDGVGVTFSDCTIDPKGNLTRYPVIDEYVKLTFVQTLYSLPFDTNPSAHIAVAPDGRVYYSAQPEIVDYDPGTQCPNPALTVSNLYTYANAPLALDSSGNLYASDPSGPSIHVYPPGNPAPSKTITQTYGSQSVQLVIQ